MNYPLDPLTQFAKGKKLPKATLAELINDGYIATDDNGTYHLTPAGDTALDQQ